VATAQSTTAAEDGSVKTGPAATTSAGLPRHLRRGHLARRRHAVGNHPSNTVIYTPAAGFFGADSFTFQATDPDDGNSQATVSLDHLPWWRQYGSPRRSVSPRPARCMPKDL
jgi:hypothetical protein